MSAPPWAPVGDNAVPPILLGSQPKLKHILQVDGHRTPPAAPSDRSRVGGTQRPSVVAGGRLILRRQSTAPSARRGWTSVGRGTCELA
jgi:hypothetical protein